LVLKAKILLPVACYSIFFCFTHVAVSIENIGIKKKENKNFFKTIQYSVIIGVEKYRDCEDVRLTNSIL